MEEVAFAMEVTLGRMLGDAERRGPSRGRELHRKVKAKKREGVQVCSWAGVLGWWLVWASSLTEGPESQTEESGTPQ